MCTCPRCGEKFASISAFDSHLQTKFGAMHPVQCLSPARIGLHRNARGAWSWTAPGPATGAA
jgi:hypothetical protein